MKNAPLHKLVQKFYAEFIEEMSSDDVLNLTFGAIYLDIKPLLDLCVAKMVFLIKDMSLVEARALFEAFGPNADTLIDSIIVNDLYPRACSELKIVKALLNNLTDRLCKKDSEIVSLVDRLNKKDAEMMNLNSEMKKLVERLDQKDSEFKAITCINDMQTCRIELLENQIVSMTNSIQVQDLNMSTLRATQSGLAQSMITQNRVYANLMRNATEEGTPIPAVAANRE